MAKALIVEDDDSIIPAIEEALVARGDAFDRAKSLEEARRMFRGHDYAYVLLDLKIPARDGGAFPDMAYGVTLLKEIRQTKGKETTPVIAMTSHHSDGFGIATELHAQGVNSCIPKPFDEKRPLMREIDEVLARHAQGDCPARPPKKLTPFNAEPREMVIYEDRVTVCGIEVWRDCGQPHLRTFLVRLNKKDGGGWVRLHGRELMKGLDRDDSNPVGRPIKSFCDDASTRLAEGRSLACGRYDIIDSKGGYHFTEWMVVRIDGEPEAPKAVRAPARKAAEPDGAPVLNDRKKWVLEQIENGRHISQKDVIVHFRRDWHPSTIKRDLKELRNGGQIETHPDGYYTRAKSKGN